MGTSTTAKDEMSNDKVDLRAEMRQAKVDMIKWLVGLFITLALMIIGLYFKK